MTTPRHTAQRRAVLRTVKLAEQPLTAVDIGRRVRRGLPTTAVGTIYRNIDQLVRRGEIFRLDSEVGPVYVGHAHHQAVFRCQRCGKERHLKSQTLPGYVDRKMFGHQRIFTSQLIAQGLCGSCSRKGVRRG